MPPVTLVKVPWPEGESGNWCTSLRPAREAGKLIDIALVFGRDGSYRKIYAHKIVLISYSEYFEALFTGESSAHGGGYQEVKMGKEETDFHSVEMIVACLYSGELPLSLLNVCSVIHTANLLKLSAIGKAACDFLINLLEPSIVCKMLRYAAVHAGCGDHVCDLYTRCADYLIDHIQECSLEPSYAELSNEEIVYAFTLSPKGRRFL